MIMETNYDFLTKNGVKIIQSKGGYRLTADAIQLAQFVKCKRTDVVVDIGCGGGVISLIVNDACKPKKIVAIDIQAEAAELAQRNVELNGMENVEVIHGDARKLYKGEGRSNFADVVVCNPPYFSSGPKSVEAVRAGSRHDDMLSLSELVTAATRLLKYSGTLYMCYPSEFVARAITALDSDNFRVRQLKFLHNEKGIYLVLIQAKKSTKQSEAEVTIDRGGFEFC
jgi:FkbM family methyltransferase